MLVAAEAHGFASVLSFAEKNTARARRPCPAWPASAAATSRIELGIGVWNPFLRHPAQIAMDASALDELSGGRLSLGLGSGLANPIRRLGIDNARTLAAMKDTFVIVRALLSGEALTYKGAAFSVEGARLSWRPSGLPCRS